MTCTNCGTENEAARKFCMECGSPLAAVCPSCGAPNDPRSKFCGECGSSFGSQQPAAASSRRQRPTATDQPAAERRLVSILFADLVGFTTLSEHRDAEEVRDLLTRYFDTCRRLIDLYGGTIEKFIGDAVMAVWGAPVATEDDAERAVRAGLDLVQAVADLGEEVGAPDLQARAGVLTGEAAVNLRAEGQGMVAGDLVNTASRIQSAAPPGSVYVGEVTRRATEAAIVYENAGAFELKGKAEPVRLWRGLRVVAGARGDLKSTGLEAPFVGRDRELRTVKELFIASAEDAKAHLVSVIGVAGIGKSRLAWEFYKYFDGLPQITYYHRGRCLAYGEGVAYWALAEMVKMRARIAEVEDPLSAAAKLRASLKEHVPDPDERRWVEPRLGHLIGLDELAAAADRDDLFAAWRLFFERLAQKYPTVMVFEDMQWADASLVDFIEYLMEWSRQYPILVLALARPEFLERRPTWGVGKRNFTSLYLEPLPREAIEELLTGLVPGLPGALVAQILARAEGIPLYAVETVRMLLDKGLLAEEGSVYRPTRSIASLDVPETLQALIASRLDGLAPQERRLVQDASVLGKSFFKKGLASLSGLSESELEPLLSSLVRKEVLAQQADTRSPEHGQYGFLQDLVKKVAYDTLSKRERKAKHLAAAAFIEEGWGGEEEEVVEVVAAHYLQAYQAEPAASDASEIKAKAVNMLTRAGERAASLGAAEEALRYFEQALQLAEEPLLGAELHERAGRMAALASRMAEARSHFQHAIDAFAAIGLTHPAARVSAALGEVTYREGRIEEAIEGMERAFAVLSEDEPDADLATLAAQLGRFLWLAGRIDRAVERIDFALEVAESLRLYETLSHALNSKGVLLESVRGRPEEGSTLLRRALEIALERDLPSAAIRAYNNQAAIASHRDLHEATLASARAGFELAQRVGDRPWGLLLRCIIVSGLVYLGRWDEAILTADEVRKEEGVEMHTSTDLATVCQVHVHRGSVAEAREWMTLFAGAEATPDTQSRAAYQTARATVLRAEGNLADALSAGEAALRLRTEIGVTSTITKDAVVEALEAAFDLSDQAKMEELLGVIEGLRPVDLTPFYQAQGARFGARLAALRGEAEGVQSGFEAAAVAFRDVSMRFWLAVTLLEHCEWLIGVARREDAEPLLAEARNIFEDLKARPWLDRLARAQASMAATVAPA